MCICVFFVCVRVDVHVHAYRHDALVVRAAQQCAHWLGRQRQMNQTLEAPSLGQLHWVLFFC